MTEVTIRAARPGDAAAIWEILRPIFRAGDTYTVDADIPEAEAVAYWTQARTFVAEAQGRVLGTYYLRRNQGGGGAHVCNCGYATHPDARGRGVARAMLAHSLTEARTRGFRAMQYNFVVATNLRAIDTWTRAGFREVGRLPGAFLHPQHGFVDALVLYRELGDGT